MKFKDFQEPDLF